ncbi:MAG: hypothetical protein JRI23_14265, partial [Deltaproteobacteria bacterium]|nr:hypothetical protein [Deltaproteobacteria bacterium]MBW2532909.1 hypothetical protein [Deltaproteobacteria bacterium]
MARLAERLAQLLGRVEILARGAEDLRRAGTEAFARGQVLEARAHARAVLRRVPGSPWALAMWADAAEAAGFDDEVAEALAALAEQIPWQQEIWLRLGLARVAIGAAGAREALERAAAMVGSGEAELTRRALLSLCDLDLAGSEPRRAVRWLETVPAHHQSDPAVALRRVECALALGDDAGAQRWAAALAETERSDGRDRLA